MTKNQRRQLRDELKREAAHEARIVTAARKGWFSVVHDEIQKINTNAEGAPSQSDLQEAFKISREIGRPLVFRTILAEAGDFLQPLDIRNAMDDARRIAVDAEDEIRQIENKDGIHYKRLHQKIQRFHSISDRAEIELRRRDAELSYEERPRPVPVQSGIGKGMTLDLQRR